MSLVCRTGELDDVPGIARLAAHSFPGVGSSHAEWEAAFTGSTPADLETVWVAEEDGRLRGVCRLLRFEQWIGGAAIPVMGLSTVAVSAAARRRGVAADLVITGLRRARERGDVASVLYPFRTAFYRGLGYGMAGEVHQYSVPPAAFPDDPGRSRVDLAASLEDREAIASVYEQWAPRQTGQLSRSSQSWDPVWQNDTRHGAIYRGEDGEPAGYMVFRYHLEGQGKNTLEIEESAWLTADARRALYGWLSSLGDQWDMIVYRAHPQELFGENLRELRHQFTPVTRWHLWFPASVSLLGPMFRLLDVGRAWEARRLNEGRSTSLALRVHDARLEEEARWWTLRMANTRTSVTEGRPQSPELTLELDIEDLSRIYIGSLTPSAAVRLGKARVDRPNLVPLLDRLLAVPLPWTFDRF